ncbi:hypothetical protein Tco_1384872 [Tanacetum coccineum]
MPPDLPRAELVAKSKSTLPRKDFTTKTSDETMIEKSLNGFGDGAKESMQSCLEPPGDIGLTIYPIKIQDEEEYIAGIDVVVVFGSRSTPPSSPPSPPHDDQDPAPSPSDSDDDTTFDNEKYSCITLCSLQACHGGSDMKNCLTSCIDKC